MSDQLIDERGKENRGFLDGLFIFLPDQQHQPTLCICTAAASETDWERTARN